MDPAGTFDNTNIFFLAYAAGFIRPLCPSLSFDMNIYSSRVYQVRTLRCFASQFQFVQSLTVFIAIFLIL